ncbi:protein SAR DEFICIENT 1-like [Carya illinoinensis]|uniref:protein SAR DEFICIENT 1-like n=1 Tax=Carya illinoinensis TaxID=32201 RepID=UPI001C7297A3|nr:protein SAR DEFICIENT 1-like [Carya illinoinensis]
MSAKRLFTESQYKEDEPAEKQLKPSLLSVASDIGKVIGLNSMNKILSDLEPRLRRLVNEELENALSNSHFFTRFHSLETQAEVETSSCLQLMFNKKVLPPTLFTASKIADKDNNPLQVVLVESSTTSAGTDHDLSLYPTKIEIVVLNGGFPLGGGETWSSEEFNKNIMKERDGKRPLLAGELCVTMKERLAHVGDIEFTDNSSWIRCRKFRLGARVVPGSYKGTVRILEAITEPFVVKDHRGESYKKNHPPMLEDEVWRLEKIGRHGKFHEKLSSQGINTVQDFLKLSVVDTPRLREILGTGMSEKMWEVTIKHARTCVLGNKQYSFQGNNNCVFILNPICEVVGALIDVDGQLVTVAPSDLSVLTNYNIESLVRAAYENWNSLQEVPGNYIFQ